MMKSYLRMLSLVILVAASASAQQVLTTTLSGSNEPDGGDPDGFGTAVIVINGTTINFLITANNLSTITGAHIHRGLPGVNGGIVVNPSLVFNGTVANASFGPVSQTLIDEILTNPANFYFNVHSNEKPGGAIRGQLTGGATSVAGGSPVKTTENPGTCTTSDTVMCLNGDRFRVEATWSTPDGKSGAGHAVRLQSDSGYFWFFNSTNIEVTAKVLNACSISTKQWVFAAGLTNVQVSLKVTDTRTGDVRVYNNPNGSAFLPIQDTSAFACP